MLDAHVAPCGAGFDVPTASVNLVHTETKIGDTLCTLPLLLQIAGAFDTPISVRGAFSDAVKPLVRNLPIAFGAAGGSGTILDFHVGIERAYDHGNSVDEHMAVAMCRLAGLRLPALPIALDLVSEPTRWHAGIVISPFSGSRNPWYKLWPMERWAVVARRLKDSAGGTPVYIVGGRDEDYAAFTQSGATPLAGLPLTEVLSVLRLAEVFLSIDNGLSHLAHFGAVDRHVLLYPQILAPNLVRNPRATILRGMPEDISVQDVLGAAAAVLRRRLTHRVAGAEVSA